MDYRSSAFWIGYDACTLKIRDRGFNGAEDYTMTTDFVFHPRAFRRGYLFCLAREEKKIEKEAKRIIRIGEMIK